MTINHKYDQPVFSLSLLKPQNWGVWLGFALLALIVNLLPYVALTKIGHAFGQLGLKYGKQRAHIVRKNLELSFPDMPDNERNQFVIKNFSNTGMALVETGIAWFWPTWRFKRLIATKNIEALKRCDDERRGVLLCCVHALNLEVTARAFAVMGYPGYGAYRPHDNPAYNWIQYRGRSQNGNKLIDRKDLKQMIRVLKNCGRLFYLPDHDYGRNKSVFVPFFAVQEACTTTGTSILAYSSGCAIIPGSGFRDDNGKYQLVADKTIDENYPKNDEVAAAAYMNRYVEETILCAPEQWMWLHKRYKTAKDPQVKKGLKYLQ